MCSPCTTLRNLLEGRNLKSQHHVDVRAEVEGIVSTEARGARVPVAHIAAKHQLSDGVQRRAIGIMVITVELRVCGELGHHAAAFDVWVLLATSVGGRQRHVMTPLQHTHGHQHVLVKRVPLRLLPEHVTQKSRILR